MRRYTNDEVAFLKEHIPGRGNAELAKLFNQHFENKITVAQAKSFKCNNKLKSGLDCRFRKGMDPWNKGKSYRPGGRVPPVGLISKNGGCFQHRITGGMV